MIYNDEEYVVAMLIDREYLIIYGQVLLRTLRNWKRVQEARGLVTWYRGLPALIAIGYVALYISVHTFPVVAWSN